ncbi:Hemicentin-2 [Armadillidium nasatum]|uniref:Hemicentin-2 n=1 Tax=Armadillidium nasatum TaxID=96803 RepID=A0A5N5SQH2_9CRUS|nr:Hemicentin-2 [Armadillidium nasatum]
MVLAGASGGAYEEPPRSLSIVSSWDGERKAGDVIGPYPENSEISLSCQVIGGIPPPRVTWWHEGSLLDDGSEVKSDGVIRNTLHMPKLTRADLLKTITCQAVNSNLTVPLTKSVTIDLAYPPSAIKITSTQDNELRDDLKISHKIPSSVTCVNGETCPLECRISSPPGAKERGLMRDSSSYSTLMLTALPKDDGAIISCKASNKPQLKLKVNKGLDLLNIEEGEDLEFECNVKSNPEITEIHWTRNWIPVVQNASYGIVLSKGGSVLHLRNVNRLLSGHYACAAANTRGSGTSNSVLLSIKFSPKCSSRQVTSVGIGKSESANVTCRVDAHPTATIFRWAFNSSDELIDIPFDQQIEKNDSSNTITYQPRSPFDFGDLLCWASNSVGTMKEPCVIKILPIDKPEGVRGCKVSSNGTVPDGLVIVSCLPGWDGGLSQSFTLEVRKAAHVHARILAALQHSTNPVFHLRNLQPGQEYLLTVTSANPRGTSPSVTLSYTPPGEVIAGLTKKHSSPKSTFMKFLPFVAIFIAIVVVLTTCVSIIACIAKSKAAEKADIRKDQQRRESLESRKASVQHSLPPDRGKDDVEDDENAKEHPEHYCAVHGHERLENEYISYKHYFNNIRDDMETQHLLKSSVGGSSGMDNQLNACSSTSSNSRDSSSSCGMDGSPPKGIATENPYGPSVFQRYSEGNFRGLAPLASVDSLSGFSTISNHSSASKKTEGSSHKSFQAIPEIVTCNDSVNLPNGFVHKPKNSTLPSIKITPVKPIYDPPSVTESLYHPRPFVSLNQTLGENNGQVLLDTTSSIRIPVNSGHKPTSDTYFQPYQLPHIINSTASIKSNLYEVNSIPQLPPPSISTHPVFINEKFKGIRAENGIYNPPLEYLSCERKLSKESSV